jgi:hypothetical protein
VDRHGFANRCGRIDPLAAAGGYDMTISFDKVIPVLRMFDIAKADEFYQGFLGFSVDFDHRFEPVLHSTDRFRAAICSCI